LNEKKIKKEKEKKEKKERLKGDEMILNNDFNLNDFDEKNIEMNKIEVINNDSNIEEIKVLNKDDLLKEFLKEKNEILSKMNNLFEKYEKLLN
jgi:hypothetical protein